jgi:hypothetical protein
MPSAPPRCRDVVTTPEATPASSTGTVLSAAVVIGPIAIPMPTPPTSIRGSMSRKLGCALSVEKLQSATASSSIPTAIGQRGPIRSVVFPASGADTTTSGVIGRKTTPA